MIRCISLGLLLVMGCSNLVDPPGKALQSKLERITTAPPQTVLDATVAANTSTALKLFGKLREGDENLFFSPHSIITVLGLTMGGASGATRTEFETLLHVSNAADFHRSMNHLDRELSTRGRHSQGANGEPFALHILDQVFVDSSLPVEPGYLDLLQQEYGAAGRQLDFANSTADATKRINEWVSSATQKHIPNLLGDEVTNRTRLVLLNAMYFSSAWAEKFEVNLTANQSFTGLASVVTLPMMRNSSFTTKEFETTELQAVELDYSGNELSMVIIMPKADYRPWEDALDLAKITTVRDGLMPTLVDLSMPKFETRSQRDLRPPLEASGLKSVFKEGEADLSAMSREALYLSFLRHEAWIDVSESGTRAAAATAGGGSLPSAPPQPKRIIIDRPFFYFIQDKATNAVLFAGRFVKAP